MLKVSRLKHVVTVFVNSKTFNVSGLGTPDDLVEFREQQRGFQARLERWSDISRGHHTWCYTQNHNAKDLDINPVMIGTEFTHEGLYVNQHGHWKQLMLQGLNQNALKMTDEDALVPGGACTQRFMFCGGGLSHVYGITICS